jgi:hypothetical protein
MSTEIDRSISPLELVRGVLAPEVVAQTACSGTPRDLDEDGIPNIDDRDIDGDGIPNHADMDMDGDGISNDQDPDMD